MTTYELTRFGEVVQDDDECCKCGEIVPVTENAHFPHEDNCPNADGNSDCTCDLIAHAWCCVNCDDTDEVRQVHSQSTMHLVGASERGPAAK